MKSIHVVTGRARIRMVLLFLLAVYPNYYSWWVFVNYYNDEFYSQYWHQVFFTATEICSTLTVLASIDRDTPFTSRRLQTIVGYVKTRNTTISVLTTLSNKVLRVFI